MTKDLIKELLRHYDQMDQKTARYCVSLILTLPKREQAHYLRKVYDRVTVVSVDGGGFKLI